MAEHNALGTPGGARGVDDGRQGIRVAVTLDKLRRRLRQPILGDHHARIRGRDRECRGTRLQDDDAGRKGHIAENLGQPLPASGVVDQQQLDRRILQDIGRVLRSVVRVEGHRDQSERQRRLIEDHPIGAIAQQDGDPVPAVERLARERPVPACNPLARFGPGQLRPPGVALEMAIGDPRRRALDALNEEPVQGLGAVDRDQVLGPSAHGLSSWSRRPSQ